MCGQRRLQLLQRRIVGHVARLDAGQHRAVLRANRLGVLGTDAIARNENKCVMVIE